MICNEMDGATMARIVDGYLLFIEQEGVVIEDEAADDMESAPCCVCGGSQPADGMRGPCSAQCYALWNAMPDDDPREWGWL